MNNTLLDQKQLLIRIIKTFKENRQKEFQLLLEELQPYDIAEIYTSLPAKHHHKFLVFSTPEQIAILIQELDTDAQIKLIQQLGGRRASQVLDLMENDDLADLLSELSVEKIDEYLNLMKTEESKTVQDLMSYPSDTAGGIMTNRFVWIRSYYTVREAVDKLKTFASYAENIYYLYVLDEHKKLAGVVSYRDLLIADGQDRIEDIMFNRVISVPVDMDQEEVARVIERYDFIAVPVVDHEGYLVGIVTVDDIIDVMIDEANEDFEKLSATGKSIGFQTNAFLSVARRLPWLILLLILGLISGSVIQSFEETLEQVLALMFFMPMIAGMTGNTGTQSLAIVIRGMLSNDLDRKTVWKLILRETSVGIMIGITCGVLISIVAYVWMRNPYLSLVVGVSLLLTLIMGTLAGTLIPLLLHKLKIDPAVASGPLITTLNDIFSLFIYFGMATMFLHYLL